MFKVISAKIKEADCTPYTSATYLYSIQLRFGIYLGSVHVIKGLISTFAERQNSVQDDNQQHVHHKSTDDGE